MEARNLNQVDWSGNWNLERLSTPSAAVRALQQGLETLRLWWQRSRSRRQLRELRSRDARFFLDIGVDRATVYREGSKWFWQA